MYSGNQSSNHHKCRKSDCHKLYICFQSVKFFFVLFHYFFRLSVLVCLSDISTLSKSLKLWNKHSFTYVIRFVSFSQMLVFQCILLIIYICSFYWFGHSTCSNNWETSRGFNTYLAAISTINILKTNIHTIKPSMQLIIPDIHSAGCIFRVFRVIIEITIPINEHNGPQNMTSI